MKNGNAKSSGHRGAVMERTETTEQQLRNADFSGQIGAIGKAQAVIEFNHLGRRADFGSD